MNTNISSQPAIELVLSDFLGLLSQPARIQILLAIGEDEACVCHIEAATQMRQASISQHLMRLRQAGLVFARREGRNMYYRLVDPSILGIYREAARLRGLPAEALIRQPIEGCPCPLCNPGDPCEC